MSSSTQWGHLPDADDVRAAHLAVAEALNSRPIDSTDLRARAGPLTFSCARTLAHTVDAVLWYSANLACRSSTDMETPLLSPRKPLGYMLSCFESAANLLALAVAEAPPEARGYHAWGRADTSGFAAMGCDEMLVHGWDIAQGLGLDFDPPTQTVERTLRRLFPWAPAPPDADPWQALLWANGRVELDGRPAEKRWLWHNEPLDEWNGEVRRWKPRRRSS